MKDMERLGDALVVALAVVTNIRFRKNSLAQMVLPVRLGGLGIKMTKDIALPVFIPSLHAEREFVDGVLNNILLPESNNLSASERCRKTIDGLISTEGGDFN